MSLDHESDVAKAHTFELGSSSVTVIVDIQVESRFEIIKDAVADIAKNRVRRGGGQRVFLARFISEVSFETGRLVAARHFESAHDKKVSWVERSCSRNMDSTAIKGKSRLRKTAQKRSVDRNSFIFS